MSPRPLAAPCAVLAWLGCTGCLLEPLERDASPPADAPHEAGATETDPLPDRARGRTPAVGRHRPRPASFVRPPLVLAQAEDDAIAEEDDELDTADEEPDAIEAADLPEDASPEERERAGDVLTAALQRERSGRTFVRSSVGFFADPGAFDWTASAGHFLTENFSLGGLFQLGVGDNPLIVAPTLHAEWMFDLPSSETVRVARLKPFVQGGVGFAYIEKDRPNTDDVGFLLEVGFGTEYYLREDLSVGSDFLFNILPVDTAGENFIFSWRVLALRYHF